MIALMGLRGSGKSTLGAMLAHRLGRPFIDLDDVTAATLREAHGLDPASTIGDMFQSLGEPAFREAEAAALRGLLDAGEPTLILALGGGTPTAPGAAKAMQAAKETGRLRIVWLHLPPETLAARIESDDLSNRPALMGADPVSEMHAVYEARRACFESLASETIELDGLTIDQAMDLLIDIAGHDSHC